MRCVPPREGCPPARTHQDLSATNAEAKHSLRFYGPVSLRIWGQDRRGHSRTLCPNAAAVHLGHHATPAQQHRGSGKCPGKIRLTTLRAITLGGRGVKYRPRDHPDGDQPSPKLGKQRWVTRKESKDHKQGVHSRLPKWQRGPLLEAQPRWGIQTFTPF